MIDNRQTVEFEGKEYVVFTVNTHGPDWRHYRRSWLYNFGDIKQDCPTELVEQLKQQFGDNFVLAELNPNDIGN